MSQNSAFLGNRSSSSLGVEVRHISRERCLGPRTPRVFTPAYDPGHKWRPTWWPYCLACCWLLAGKAECNLSLLSGQTIGLGRMDLEHVRKGGVERSYTGLHGVGWGIHAPPVEKSSQGLKKHISVVGGATYTRLSHVLTPAVCGLFCLGCSQPCLPFGKTWNVISSEKPSLTFLEN